VSNVNLSPNPAIVEQLTESGAVLVNSETGDCFELNHVGAKVWTRLRRREPRERIVDALALEFAVERTILDADVSNLIEALARNGVLVVPK
jgi:hypothetical protein